jgi:hypothetical protein
MLSEESNRNIWSRHCKYSEDLVQHLYIHSRKAMELFEGNFPNVRELTHSKYFDILDDLIVSSLNSIIHLKQLTKLTLDHHCLPVEQLARFLLSKSNQNTRHLSLLCITKQR